MFVDCSYPVTDLLLEACVLKLFVVPCWEVLHAAESAGFALKSLSTVVFPLRCFHLPVFHFLLDLARWCSQ